MGFDPNNHYELPGTRVNRVSDRREPIVVATRGRVLLPLLDHDWGPVGRFIEIDSASPDSAMAQLGYSVFDDHPNMLMIREAFKNTRTVIVYIPSNGERATVTAGNLTGTARQGGERGNKLQWNAVTNPSSGFDVTVFLDTEEIATYEGLTTIAELIAQNDSWIEFKGEGDLQATASAQLAGGTNGTLTTANISEFIDKSDAVRWNCLAFPLSPTGETGDDIPALQAAVVSKIRSLRNEIGKYRTAVVANLATGLAGDFDGILNVTNTVGWGAVDSGDYVDVTLAQVVAWVAGADAGASNTQSNTYLTYRGATRIIGEKDYDASVAASKRGEFFFTYSEAGEVVVQHDINCLTDFSRPNDETYRKNRVRRVHDTFRESLKLNFPPNKFDNSEEGWDIMEGIGRSILLAFENAGAITNVNLNADFLVDRSKSTGDQTFFDIGLQAVDSSEKLFFTVRTR